MDDFAKILKQLMLARRMNQVELAKVSGVKQQLISNYLSKSDSGKLPTLKNLLALAKALRCSPAVLLGFDEKEIDPKAKKLLDLYVKLSDDQKEAIENIAKTLHDSHVKQDKKEGDS